MIGKKPGIDEFIDGDRTIFSWIIARGRTTSPYVIYGGLMGICAIVGALIYVLYRTYNLRVKVLLLLALLVGVGIFLKMDWRYALLGGLGLALLGGCFVAYLNLKDYVRIDATVVPARNSPIDGRWDVGKVSMWLGKNGLGEYAPKFEQEKLVGKDVLQLTDSRLQTLPLNVSNKKHREQILSAIDKGLRLRRARRRYREGATPSEALVAAATAARSFAERFINQVIAKGTAADIKRDPYKALDKHHDHDYELETPPMPPSASAATVASNSAEAKLAVEDFKKEQSRLDRLRVSASPPTRRIRNSVSNSTNPQPSATSG